MAIPNVPGVPALPSYAAAGDLTLLTSDSVSALVGAGPAQWGIYDSSGALVIEPDSFTSVDYKHEWVISDYPIEQGKFADYNKVQTPFQTKVVMTKGGSVADKAAFLNTLESIAGSLDLYSVVTPEYTYANVNIDHIGYSRKARQGLGLLTVEIWLEEIRLSATSAFTSTVNPQSATPTQNGTVIVEGVTPAQQATLSDGSSGGWGPSFNDLAGQTGAVADNGSWGPSFNQLAGVQ